MTAPVQSPELTTPQHAWADTPDQVLADLATSSEGLSDSDAERRLREVGRNELPAPKPVPAWRRFLGQFDDVLIYILIAAAVLKAIMGDWVDFAVIAIVIVVTALIGYIQEGRAASALASLQKMQSLDAQVFRDGGWHVEDATTLVPGDIVRVRSGDKVPADVRLLEASNLQVEESALTGESVAATKDVPAVSTEALLGDRSSMLFSSTIVQAGNGEGVVVATGANTEIGRISALVSEQEAVDTPLTKQLAKLGKQISLLIGALAVIMLLVGRLSHDWPVDELLSAAIGFAVAAVPEGLPALVTITLAVGVQQMAKRRAIARKMPAVEALGSVTTICSDKTGTLTQNEMTARTVVTATERYSVEGTGYAPEGRIVTESGEAAQLSDHPDLAHLVLAAGCSNDAKVEETEDGWHVVGAPTEGALDVLAIKAGADLAGMERLDQVPFESSHKFSGTLDENRDGERVVHALGAPDRLLDRATHQFSATGERISLDREHWEAEIDRLSAQGLRLLAAASRPADGENSLDLSDIRGLTFLGLVGIVDPPRPEVTEAIKRTHAAGIRVKMITGDHKGTATAIARELGIAPATGEVPALTGADLEAMNNDELSQVVRDVDVYARTSPEHKLRIVRALQGHGEVVAMTGDGVNDAPSITRADVGIAMGIKGTEATKEAADIVLADDNFATIQRAVEEGRRIYDNIRKSVVFLLPSNGAQSLVILIAVLLGIALPLSPVQILWINLATAITLSLPLADEPAEPGIMQRPPRNPREQVLSPRALAVVLLASALIGGAALGMYEVALTRTEDYGMAQTTAVLMLAMGQFAFLFNCRFLNSSSLTWRVLVGNRGVWISAGALLILQLLFTYAPFMHTWFGSASIGLAQWGATAVIAFGLFLLIELGKWIIRRVPAPEYRRHRLAAPIEPELEDAAAS